MERKARGAVDREFQIKISGIITRRIEPDEYDGDFVEFESVVLERGVEHSDVTKESQSSSERQVDQQDHLLRKVEFVSHVILGHVNHPVSTDSTSLVHWLDCCTCTDERVTLEFFKCFLD